MNEAINLDLITIDYTGENLSLMTIDERNSAREFLVHQLISLEEGVVPTYIVASVYSVGQTIHEIASQSRYSTYGSGFEFLQQPVVTELQFLPDPLYYLRNSAGLKRALFIYDDKHLVRNNSVNTRTNHWTPWVSKSGRSVQDHLKRIVLI